MEFLKKLHLIYLTLILSLISSQTLWANSGKLKSWGGDVVRQGQSIGLSWMTAALVVCGFLSLLGLQFAQGMLARILVGSGLIFGAGAIGTVLKSIFT